jgi:hypothetical protein
MGLSLLWQRFRYTQVFVGVHDETLSVVAVRVNETDSSIEAIELGIRFTKCAASQTGSSRKATGLRRLLT